MSWKNTEAKGRHEIAHAGPFKNFSRSGLHLPFCFSLSPVTLMSSEPLGAVGPRQPGCVVMSNMVVRQSNREQVKRSEK